MQDTCRLVAGNFVPNLRAAGESPDKMRECQPVLSCLAIFPRVPNNAQQHDPSLRRPQVPVFWVLDPISLITKASVS